MRKKLYLFDFDGTLTSHDTLLCFIRYACGTWRFLMGFALFSPLLLLMKLRLYPNYRAKQRIFAWYFRGMPLADFDALCRRFAASSSHLMRPAALDCLRDVFAEGYEVLIVSASIDNWVSPFFTTLKRESDSEFHVLGTQVEAGADGKLTGRFLTPNCYGAEKVNRINALLPDVVENRDSYEIVAFGDSRGDREMLAMADEVHYKPFR